VIRMGLSPRGHSERSWVFDPPKRNEDHMLRHPRQSGGPLSDPNAMDSRSPAFAEDKFRGNDLNFERLWRSVSCCVHAGWAFRHPREEMLCIRIT